MRSRSGSYRFKLLPALCVLAFACDSDQIATVGGARRTVIELDVAGLTSPASDRQPVGVSVAASLTLAATSRSGRRQVIERDLTPSDSVVTLEVIVEVGMVSFSADVFSNNGTRIYTGDTQVEVTTDGFDVALDLKPVDAVLVLFPPSVILDSIGRDTFLVENRGSESLVWEVDSISPPQDSCNPALGNCLAFEPPSGRTAPRGVDTVIVRRLASPIRTYDVRFGSQVGSVAASVEVTVPPPPPTVELSADGSDTTLVVGSGEQVTLSWTVLGAATSCVASGDWSGLKDCSGGSESIGPLPGPDSLDFILTVENEFGGDEDSVAVFVLENQRPVPSIASPANGSIFALGEFVAFEGSALDAEDGPLMGQALVWTSSQHGVIGVGLSFQHSNLDPGVHEIVLRATDSQGASAADSISIAVNQPPLASILAPSDAAIFNEGDPIAFQGAGSDPEDGPLSGGALLWNSSRDGVIGTGTSFTRADLSGGTHTVSLEAADSQGASDTTSVTITVNRRPAVQIELPNDGSTFNERSLITFRGQAVDPEEGPLLGNALVWTLDSADTIGSGITFERADLTPGPHTITLTGTDSQGASAAASIDLTVNARPVVSIESPTDGSAFFATDRILLRASVSDAEQGSLPSSALVWTSSLDGALGTSDSIVVGLSLGDHIVSLTATDPLGASGADTVRIAVRENGQWLEITAPIGTPSPSPLTGHSAVLDASLNRMIVFGGQDTLRQAVNDVWMLTNANGLTGTPIWERVAVAGTPPEPRIGHTAVYDPTTSRMIIFGGMDSSSVFREDLWLLDMSRPGTAAWSNVKIGGPVPDGRWFHSAVYDETNNRMYMFGGQDSVQFLNDVWELQNANGTAIPAWTELMPTGVPPAPRAGHSAVYDAGSKRMIVFGGLIGGGATRDVWILSIGAASWSPLAASGDSLPSARSNQTGVYDGATNRMTIFGGVDPIRLGTVENDAWVLSNANGLGGNATWKALAPVGGPPPGRGAHTALYDPIVNRMIVFGGSVSAGISFEPTKDVWVLTKANGVP